MSLEGTAPSILYRIVGIAMESVCLPGKSILEIDGILDREEAIAFAINYEAWWQFSIHDLSAHSVNPFTYQALAATTVVPAVFLCRTHNQ